MSTLLLKSVESYRLIIRKLHSHVAQDWRGFKGPETSVAPNFTGACSKQESILTELGRVGSKERVPSITGPAE